MKQFSALIVIASLLLSAVSADAFDEVSRRSDKPIRGGITDVTRDGVKIKPPAGADVTVPANDILDIRWDDEPLALSGARVAARNGNTERAIEELGKSASDPKAKGDIKAEIDFLMASLIAQNGLDKSDAAQLEDAAKKLDAFTKANGSNARFFDAVFLLGRVQLARQEFDGAAAAFQQLSQAPWSDYKMAAQNASAKLALKKGDLASALSSFEAVLGQTASSPAEISRRNEALLGKATVTLQQGNAQQALDTVNQALQAADPEDSSVQAEAFVRKGDSLRLLGKTKEAILAYLHVPVLFEKEAALNAEALYHLSSLWATAGQPERGLAASQELRENYPNTEWAKKLGQ
ncbi:tetratricopeptide repeat protein [bacterium]|nr:tetratricopeptide repeat protein [bacterium]